MACWSFVCGAPYLFIYSNIQCVHHTLAHEHTTASAVAARFSRSFVFVSKMGFVFSFLVFWPDLLPAKMYIHMQNVHIYLLWGNSSQPKTTTVAMMTDEEEWAENNRHEWWINGNDVHWGSVGIASVHLGSLAIVDMRLFLFYHDLFWLVSIHIRSQVCLFIMRWGSIPYMFTYMLWLEHQFLQFPITNYFEKKKTIIESRSSKLYSNFEWNEIFEISVKHSYVSLLSWNSNWFDCRSLTYRLHTYSIHSRLSFTYILHAFWNNNLIT